MYFCYLIKSSKETCINEAYIGFTDNPLNRLREHNGQIKGGAKATSKKRPWTLQLVVSNFPNKILALMFEWSWQNPFESKFIKDEINKEDFKLKKTSSKERKTFYQSVEFKIKILKFIINSAFFKEISLRVHIFNVKFVFINSFPVGRNS